MKKVTIEGKDFFIFLKHFTNDLDKVEGISKKKLKKRKAITEATIAVKGEHVEEFGVIGYGIAECSKKDEFNRRIGRLIAVGRALESAGFKKADRKYLLKQFEASL